MRILRIIALSIVTLILGVIVWWQVAYPTYSYRYRLTLTIEAEGKIHTGSSVIEVRWVGQPYVPGVGSYLPFIRGQATFIDLGSRGAVIASLRNQDYGRGSDGTWSAIWIAARAFGNEGGDANLRQLTRLAGLRHLSADNLPQLIWFSNISDPSTAQRIPVADIPKLSGPEARLVDATVEITHDPIVIDIDKKLPWYKELAARQKARGIISYPGQFHLSYSMFAEE
jgi:hypothetical protein